MNNNDSPWQQLYSLDRSGVNELVVNGIIAVTDGSTTEAGVARLLLEKGNVDYTLWSRSLLKPVQLASHVSILQENYAQLRPEHFALMASSHNCEDLHLRLLGEIMTIGKVRAEQLLCPPAFPGDICTRERLKLEGADPQSLFHMCSAKHFSYLMSLQAQGKPLEEYIDFDNCEHQKVEALLSQLLKRPANSFQKTTDGCQMPNHAMSVREMATLYQRVSLAAGRQLAQESLTGADSQLGLVGSFMHRFPYIMGGTNRLDTRIMQGELTAGGAHKFIAKDGADGLLAIGVLPTERFANGLGIIIKLSSGYDIRHMEVLTKRIFTTLGIELSYPTQPHSTAVKTGHIKTHFDFHASISHSGGTPVC